jgi:hypothetical protein
MLHGAPSGPYSILNDPDTGIRLPGEDNQTEGRTHIALPTIHEQLRRYAAHAVITFDQSDYRHSGLNLDEQRQAKMRYLEAGLFAFYYVSHAPFLFACPDAKTRQQLLRRLSAFGIPNGRFEIHE